MPVEAAGPPARRDPDALSAGEIPHDPDVRKALEQATPARVPVRRRSRLARAGGYLAAAGLAAAGELALRRVGVERAVPGGEGAARVLLALMLTTICLGLYELVAALLLPRVRSVVFRFNVQRVLKLVAAVLIFFSIVSVLFVGWYTTLVSLGVLSLILGFALQTPITSFFAWIYILVQSPYRVGDRVRIGEATGDVIDVGYLDTTLWEAGGDLLSSDHPSGRIVKFPNALVLDNVVFNYSWPVFPYIWNEITVHVAYESDLEFVATTMREVVEQERGSEMAERVRVYRDLLARTPVDHLQVEDHPTVIFRVNSNTWLEATVRYLVTPRRAGRVKTALLRKILERLNEAPDKVLFPKANMR